MKLGYSMLLGEYIDAQTINYTDCKSFQIVCPICREPIFKVERKEPPPVLHYLSHYEKSKAVVSDCELRIKNISGSEKETENNLARNQKLEYFLSVIRDEILKREFGSDPKNIESVKRETLRWMKAPGVNALKNLLYKHQISNNEMNSMENLSIIFDDYVKDFEYEGEAFPLTGFAIVTQKRIATDIWLHLLSPKANSNFTFLFCVGMGLLSERISSASKQRQLHQFEKDFSVIIGQLINLSKNKVNSMIDSLIRIPIGPPYAISGSNYLSKLASEICFEMLGIILRLPYFEMLKKIK